MNLSKCSLPGLVAMAAFVPAVVSAALIPSQDGTTVYDTVNNISWLADVNLPASNRFGVPVCNGSNATNTCVNASGSMSYQAAAGWVKAMNTANYLGHNNWRIPTTPIVDNSCSFVGPQTNSFGWGCSASALGSLYNALGLSAPNTAVLVPNIKVGPFSNFQPELYWSGTSLPQPTGGVGCCGTFSFNSGWQGSNIASNFLFLLPMIQGKIAGTPAASGTGLQVNPGGETVYDPIANVSWLANANLGASNTFGLPACTDPSPKACVNQNGAMNFNSAVQFIQNMNAAAYLGQSNWQIPPVDPGCASSYLCSVTNAPFQSLFYNQLGLTPGTPVVTAPDIAVGPFTDIRPYLYWTCEADTAQDPCQTTGPAPGFEWSFWFGNGFEGTDVLAHDMYVTAYFVGAPANLCAYSLSAGGQVFAASGGTGMITIATSATCPWTVSSLPAGVTITSASSGTGNGSVTFQVSPSSGGDTANSFTIDGTTFTIEQQASSILGLNFVGSLPHLAAEGGWSTTFTLVNKSAASATARTSFFTPTGPALTLPIDLPQQPAISGPLLASSLDQTIAPNASFVMQAVGPADVNYLEGSAQLQATGSVDGFEIFHYDPTQQEAVVPLETSNAPFYVLAFDNIDPVLLGFAIENISSQDVTVPVVLRDDAGNLIANRSIQLNANGHLSNVLSMQFPATAGKRGTVEFDSPNGAQISVMGIRYTPPGTMTSVPALVNVTAAGGLMAHLAAGGGWQTTFVLVNTGNTAAQAQLNFFDDTGNPLPLSLLFPQTGNSLTSATGITQPIPAHASLWLQGSGPVALQTGSAQFINTGSISGFAIFRYNPNGQEAVVPFETRNAGSYLLAFDNTNGTVTGVAVNLVSMQGATVPVIVRDDTGTQIGTGTIPLNANGHMSFLLSTASQFLNTANIRGTLEFDAPAGTQISVLGVRSPPALTFTTLPALAK